MPVVQQHMECLGPVSLITDIHKCMHMLLVQCHMEWLVHVSSMTWLHTKCVVLHGCSGTQDKGTGIVHFSSDAQPALGPFVGRLWPSYFRIITVMVLCDFRHHGFTAPSLISTLAFLHVSLHLISHGSFLSSLFSGLFISTHIPESPLLWVFFGSHW